MCFYSGLHRSWSRSGFVCSGRMLRTGRTSVRGWTHVAAIALLVTWPLAWICLIVLGSRRASRGEGSTAAATSSDAALPLTSSGGTQSAFSPAFCRSQPIHSSARMRAGLFLSRRLITALIAIWGIERGEGRRFTFIERHHVKDCPRLVGSNGDRAGLKAEKGVSKRISGMGDVRDWSVFYGFGNEELAGDDSGLLAVKWGESSKRGNHQRRVP